VDNEGKRCSYSTKKPRRRIAVLFFGVRLMLKIAELPAGCEIRGRQLHIIYQLNN